MSGGLSGKRVPAIGRLPRYGVAFCALPDNEQSLCMMGPDGQPRMIIPGVNQMASLGHPAFRRAYPDFWFSPGMTISLPRKVDAVLNLCTSTDICAQGIIALDKVAPVNVLIFNHPRAIPLIRRDRLAESLASVESLVTPNAVRFVARSPQSFTRHFTEGGFRYPVRVETGDAWGVSYSIAQPGDWQQILATRWGGRIFTMIQETANRSPWHLLVGAVCGSGHAEVFHEEKAKPASFPFDTRDLQQFLKSLTVSLRGCIPLDCWSIELLLDPIKPTVLRMTAGLPPATAGGAAREAASARLRNALEPQLGTRLADPSSWSLAGWSLPTVSDQLGMAVV